MINPELQWCHQVSCTDMCWPHTESNNPDGKKGPLTGCSNCTRLLAHTPKRYFMTPDQLQLCYTHASDFVYNSPPCPQGRHKVVGLFGGDPLLAPDFPTYVDIAIATIPDAHRRGLWCSLHWPTYVHPKYGPAKPHVIRLLGSRNAPDRHNNWHHQGYLNWNQHEESQKCQHQPLLVAIQDVVHDPKRRWQLISDCWVQREWSSAYALDHNGEPKFYFCEVASAFDRIFKLGTGLPVEKDCWRGDLKFETNAEGVLEPIGKFAEQIRSTCWRCGAGLPLPGRRDREWKDDISRTNLIPLQMLGSPMVKRGDIVEFTPEMIETYNEDQIRRGTNWQPSRYIKEKAKK